jgi:hypothetical protein
VAFLVLIVALAAGARAWYLVEVSPADAAAGAVPFRAQDDWPEVKVAIEGESAHRSTTVLDQLARNLSADRGFLATAPLAPVEGTTRQPLEESTAHVAPGYPWLLSLAHRAVSEDTVPLLVRWVQCGLGALTAGLYFLFARRAFRSVVVALLAGLLCALHPFWIINTAEINDGVLASALLAVVLLFGTRAGETGDAVSSLLFGLALAGLTLVRAALLPFTFVGLLWFLVRCRTLPRGWLCAVLAVLGFTNGVAAWTVRNSKEFNDVLPIVDSAYLHLWIGNNPYTTGGPLDEDTIEAALGAKELQTLLEIPEQDQRYRLLARHVVAYVVHDPAAAVHNRIAAGLCFYLGQGWFTHLPPGRAAAVASNVPAWLTDNYALIVNSLLLGMLLLGLLGWRWTHSQRFRSGLAAVATVWIPLPYILSHAETLWGPRLPLDGVILCYVAFAVVCLLPGLRGTLRRQTTRA